MDSTPQTIPATDGYPLGATFWAAAGTPQGVVVMHPATGVPQRIYQAFAQFLAERGFHAITYDYRGIGASRPKTLRGFAARMRDWMLLDAEGVTRRARARYPELPQLAVGHSVGGHGIGMSGAGWGLAGAVLVAVLAGLLLMAILAPSLQTALAAFAQGAASTLVGYLVAGSLSFGLFEVFSRSPQSQPPSQPQP